MKPTIICLTPVRNNACVLERFLLSASLWADHILICDQMSTDTSREIACRFPKVRLIDNQTEEYNEKERAKLLIDEARRIQGPRLMIALDADEIFTPNVLTSTEWQTMITSEPGTVFKFQWANFCPDLKSMWLGNHFPWGYMDDGQEHISPNKMHVTRIPLPPNQKALVLNEIKVIHFQFTDWKNMLSKQRWYQCLETINNPNKSAVDIFRQYHHMFAITESQIIPIPEAWIKEYSSFGIDILSVNYQEASWFESQTLNLIKEHGAGTFRKLDIWDINWVKQAKIIDNSNWKMYKDPRNIFDKWIQRWLLKTQAKLDKRKNRRVDRFLKSILNY